MNGINLLIYYSSTWSRARSSCLRAVHKYNSSIIMCLILNGSQPNMLKYVLHGVELFGLSQIFYSPFTVMCVYNVYGGITRLAIVVLLYRPK